MLLSLAESPFPNELRCSVPSGTRWQNLPACTAVSSSSHVIRITMILKFHSTHSMNFKTDIQKGAAQENLKAELPLLLQMFTMNSCLLAEVKNVFV